MSLTSSRIAEFYKYVLSRGKTDVDQLRDSELDSFRRDKEWWESAQQMRKKWKNMSKKAQRIYKPSAEADDDDDKEAAAVSYQQKHKTCKTLKDRLAVLKLTGAPAHRNSRYVELDASDPIRVYNAQKAVDEKTTVEELYEWIDKTYPLSEKTKQAVKKRKTPLVVSRAEETLPAPDAKGEDNPLPAAGAGAAVGEPVMGWVMLPLPPSPVPDVKQQQQDSDVDDDDDVSWQRIVRRRVELEKQFDDTELKRVELENQIKAQKALADEWEKKAAAAEAAAQSQKAVTEQAKKKMTDETVRLQKVTDDLQQQNERMNVLRLAAAKIAVIEACQARIQAAEDSRLKAKSELAAMKRQIAVSPSSQ